MSIDWEKARQRYQAEARKDPGTYLLRLYQFVMSTRPSKLMIDFDHNRLSWRFIPQVQMNPSTWSDLVSRLLAGTLPSRSCPSYELELAARLLSGREDLRLTVLYPKVGQLDLEPHKPPQMTDKQSEEAIILLTITDLNLRLNRIPVWSLNLESLRSHRSWPEVFEFIKRIHHVDCHININGRRLSNLDPFPNDCLYCWTVIAPPTASHLALRELPRGKLGQSFVDLHGRTLRTIPPENLRGDHKVCHSCLFLSYSKTAGNIRLFQDGLQTTNGSSGQVGLHIWAATRELPLDLDGKNLLRGPALEEFLDQLRRLKVSFIEEANTMYLRQAGSLSKRVREQLAFLMGKQ